MTEDDRSFSQTEEEAAAFNKRFKRAVISFAVIEFIVIVCAVYYKLAR